MRRSGPTFGSLGPATDIYAFNRLNSTAPEVARMAAVGSGHHFGGPYDLLVDPILSPP